MSLMKPILTLFFALSSLAFAQTVQVKSSAGTVTFRTGAQLRGDMGLAASGANADITSMTALTTIVQDALYLRPTGSNANLIFQDNGGSNLSQFQQDNAGNTNFYFATNFKFYSFGGNPVMFCSANSVALQPGVSLAADKTITASGTTGARTINKMAGSVNFAASATSLVVTNSMVTTFSVIIATVATNDSTMRSVQAVAGSGSFTLYANAAATAETRVNFFIIN